jgi:REP element-mobilizing transposase RayT
MSKMLESGINSRYHHPKAGSTAPVTEAKNPCFSGNLHQRKICGYTEDCEKCQYECFIIADHIHMLLSVPPKFSIAMTIGYLKATSAIRIDRQLVRTQGSLLEGSFWGCGYFVSTMGIDQGEIRHYIKEQADLQKKQIELDFD